MNVIAFGDSNTYGYDPRGYFGGRYDADSRWVDILAAETGWIVCNMGAEWPGNSGYGSHLSCRYGSADRHAGNQRSASRMQSRAGSRAAGEVPRRHIPESKQDSADRTAVVGLGSMGTQPTAH